METPQNGRSSRPLSSQISPLKQHPIPLSLPPSPHATQTIFLDHPSARISSSPASSPRIVDPSPLRRGSVHPAMSDTMERGIIPGADFFDDGSSGSDWEDSEGEVTQTFSEGEGLGLWNFMHEASNPSRASLRGRSRSRDRSTLTALPPFHQPSSQRTTIRTSHGSGTQSTPLSTKRTERAREISLNSYHKDSVRIVHNYSSSGTPRGSIRSNASSTGVPFDALPRLFSDPSSASAELPRNVEPHARIRRNTSDSIIAGSIIDAHVMTMRALESLNDAPSGILTNSNSRIFDPAEAVSEFPKLSSFTNDRHVKLRPLSTKRTRRSRDRPAHLPSYFIRTPYPFTARKEFPKPKSRPRQRVVTGSLHGMEMNMNSLDRLDSGYDDNDSNKEYDDRKGQHVLGLVPSQGHYDLRSRLERNKEAQGAVRSRADSRREGQDSTIWLSLQKRSGRKVEKAPKLVKIVVPSSLTISSPDLKRREKGNVTTLDFDDKFFAEQIHAGYLSLAGNWFERSFSARVLKDIRLSQINTWSGATPQPYRPGASGLLAAGAGMDSDDDSRSPFTEQCLMNLYRNPKAGKARYTWVHWAQRVAASNTARPRSWSRRRTRSLDNNPFLFPPPAGAKADNELPICITAVQFAHAVSKLRVLMALLLMLVLSAAAALLWIFLGPAGTGIQLGEDRERHDRVGSGMLIGILVLLLESAGFGAWLWFS
ncbi:hypothetical protein DE146DRAFT_343513 [Phaeosphaeria sp. MPI-PUGE-AT-0046c]|nr:hypothetical protein DE146DRAFT_343513 [Phaeosphaeria sp. MPI-PUGE-AT-0046c]